MDMGSYGFSFNFKFWFLFILLRLGCRSKVNIRKVNTQWQSVLEYKHITINAMNSITSPNYLTLH